MHLQRFLDVVQVGISGREVTVPFDTVLYTELEVSSGFASTSSPAAIEVALRP